MNEQTHVIRFLCVMFSHVTSMLNISERQEKISSAVPSDALMLTVKVEWPVDYTFHSLEINPRSLTLLAFKLGWSPYLTLIDGLYAAVEKVPDRFWSSYSWLRNPSGPMSGHCWQQPRNIHHEPTTIGDRLFQEPVPWSTQRWFYRAIVSGNRTHVPSTAT